MYKIFPPLPEHYTLPKTYAQLGLKPLDQFLSEIPRPISDLRGIGSSTWMCATIARTLETPNVKCIIHDPNPISEYHLDLIRQYTSKLKVIKAKQYSSKGISYSNGSQVQAPMNVSFLTPGSPQEFHFIEEHWRLCLESRTKDYQQRIREVYELEDRHFLAWGAWGDALGLVSNEYVQESKCKKITPVECLVSDLIPVRKS